jgi:hypothetical protein
MRRALLLATAAVAVVPEAFAQDPQPAPERGGGAGDRGSQRDPALDAALGLPEGGPDDGFGGPPQGSFDPGFTEQAPTRQADKTYGSTARTFGADGQLQEGLTISDYSGLQEGSDEAPEYHVVQQGDTLWDISGHYMHDPYQWPKVWSYNDHVTNPHWIFPGDRIRLWDPYSDPRAQPTGPSLRFSKTRLPRGVEPGPYLLNQHAFVDAKQFETAMTVIGGAEAAVMMASLDTAYMSYDPGHPPVPGERLVVYAPQQPVYDIENKEILGYIVQIMSDVEIETVARKAAEGTIHDAVNPVERGYKVGPLRRRYRRVEPEESERSMTGLVIATLNDTAPIYVEEPWSLKRHEKRERKRERQEKRKRKKQKYVLVGEEQFVVVDLGKGDGIEVGNVLEVVRKGDEYTEKRVFKLPYEDGWPRRVVATLLVLEVQPGTALGVTTWSAKEIERGDHVELRGRDLGAGGPTEAAPAGQGQGPDADADASVQTGDGKAKAKGGFKIGG